MQIVEEVTYFDREGRENLADCLRLSLETAMKYELKRIVIFTAIGEGIESALDAISKEPRLAHLRVIGVTFAQGFEAKRGADEVSPGFPLDKRVHYRDRGVALVQAHLPFHAIVPQHVSNGPLAQDLGIVGNALNVICGSMSLCVQAVMMACDAGEVELGEHVVVMTSDTALLVWAAPTSRFLTDLIVRQLICKPAFLTISKAEPMPTMAEESASNDDDLPLLEQAE